MHHTITHRYINLNKTFVHRYVFIHIGCEFQKNKKKPEKKTWWFTLNAHYVMFLLLVVAFIYVYTSWMRRFLFVSFSTDWSCIVMEFLLHLIFIAIGYKCSAQLNSFRLLALNIATIAVSLLCCNQNHRRNSTYIDCIYE